MDFAGLSKGSHNLKPCCSETYEADGTMKFFQDFGVSKTPPGMPNTEKVGHFGSPITGEKGTDKKPMSWAKAGIPSTMKY
jgi:hypothetical protein